MGRIGAVTESPAAFKYGSQGKRRRNQFSAGYEGGKRKFRALFLRHYLRKPVLYPQGRVDIARIEACESRQTAQVRTELITQLIFREMVGPGHHRHREPDAGYDWAV